MAKPETYCKETDEGARITRCCDCKTTFWFRQRRIAKGPSRCVRCWNKRESRRKAEKKGRTGPPKQYVHESDMKDELMAYKRKNAGLTYLDACKLLASWQSRS